MKYCTDLQLGEAELKIRTRCAGGDCLGVRDEGLVVVELLDSKFECRCPLTVFRPESESETRIGYSLRGPFAAPQHRRRAVQRAQDPGYIQVAAWPLILTSLPHLKHTYCNTGRGIVLTMLI